MDSAQVEWIAQWLTAKIERIRAANERSQEMLRLSYERLAISEEILRCSVPSAWHPKPSKSSSCASAINPGNGDARALGHRMAMSDSLFDRAELAIEQASLLRKERRAFLDIQEQHIAEFRLSVLESAMARSETKAHRDNRRK
jgi:hypothetical protein